MKCTGSFRNRSHNKLIVGHSVSQRVVMYAKIVNHVYVQKTMLLHRSVAKLVY